MVSLKKALIRMEHWRGHNQQHCEEYEKLAQELDAAGMGESAVELRAMIAYSKKGDESLARAIAALDLPDKH